MANAALNTDILDKALHYAINAHSGTERRGKGFPYVVHLLEAVEIAATMTSDQEVLAAAVLHDAVEDTDCTIEDIRRDFGPRIASMVEAESDVQMPEIPEKDSWRMRKQIAIDRIAKATRDQKVVALSDKLSNMRAIARDYTRIGDELWNMFHAPGGKKDHKWHYEGLRESLRELEGTHAYAEFSGLVDKVFKNE